MGNKRSRIISYIVSILLIVLVLFTTVFLNNANIIRTAKIDDSISQAPDTAGTNSVSNIGDYMTISNLKLIREDGTEVEINKGDNPEDYEEEVGYWELIGFSFDWSINMGSTALIHDGDTAILPITGINYFSWGNTSASPIYSNGAQIGTWQHQGNNIVFTFNSNAENTSNFSGSCRVDPQMRKTSTGTTEGVETLLRFGIKNEVVKYKFSNTRTLEKQGISKAGKSAYTYTDQSIIWSFYIGQDVERYLTDPAYETNRQNTTWVNKNMRHTGCYIEDEIEDATRLTISICARVAYPISDDDPTASSSGARIEVTNKFKRLTQSAGESIDDFRNRIKEKDFQYGIYTSEDGVPTAMINFGDLPNSGLKYKDIDAYNNVQNRSGGFWTDKRKENWINTHSENNVLDGEINFFQIFVTAYYNPVVTTTQKSNTASFDLDGQVLSRTSTAGRLSPLSSIPVEVQHGYADLYVFDEETNSVIEGVKFKLQRKNDLGNYEDYTDSGEVVYYTSDSDGKIIAGPLPDGEYKFVEVEAAPKYDKDTAKYYESDIKTLLGEVHFTISNATNDGDLLYVSNLREKGTLTVKYVDESGSDIETSDVTSKNVGEDYSVSAKKIYGYENISVTGDETGKYTKEGITVTYTYKKKQGSVTIKYVDAKGNEIETADTITGDVGDSYTLAPKTIEGYEKFDVTGSETGFYKEDLTIVTYHYRKPETKVIVKYLEKTTETVLKEEYVINGRIDDDYEAEREDIAYYIAADPEPTNKKGQMTKDTITVTFYYEKAPSNIVVSYIDVDTNEEITYVDDNGDTKTYGYSKGGEIGQDYTTEELEIENYEFVSSSDNTEGKYEIGETVIFYYYKKAPFNMEIKKQIMDVKLDGLGKSIGDKGDLVKVEIEKSKIDTAELFVTYKIIVTNTEKVKGKANIVDTIPEEFEIVEVKTLDLAKNNDGNLTAEVELEPEESKEFEVVLKWKNSKNNLKTIKARAEIVSIENVINVDETNIDDNTTLVEIVVIIKTGGRGAFISKAIMMILALICIAIIIQLSKDEKIILR